MLDELEAHIDPRILAQLKAVPIRPGQPLLAVDADEVLVYLTQLGKRQLHPVLTENFVQLMRRAHAA